MTRTGPAEESISAAFYERDALKAEVAKWQSVAHRLHGVVERVGKDIYRGLIDDYHKNEIVEALTKYQDALAESEKGEG